MNKWIIEDWAFEGSSIRSIEMPDTITEIGESIFCFCKNLESVQLSKGIIKIPARVFSSCYKLQYTNNCVSHAVVNLQAEDKRITLFDTTRKNKFQIL